jgi:hypothetical protein
MIPSYNDSVSGFSPLYVRSESIAFTPRLPMTTKATVLLKICSFYSEVLCVWQDTATFISCAGEQDASSRV